MNEGIVNILEYLIIGLSIDYLFTQTHQLRVSLKKSYVLFYLSYLFFFFASYPFFDHYFVWILYFFLSLFIISHICYEENFKKRLMMIGIFGLIYMVEEMVTMILTFILFRDLWYQFHITNAYLIFRLCLRDIQIFIYCFIVAKGFSHQLNQLKQFYFIPLGQGILLIILFYLGMMKCQNIIGYILIVLTLLMIWCDYVLYQGFLTIREMKISHIKYVQSQIFTKKQNDLRKLRHDMLNHFMILETMIANNQDKEAAEYMEKMKTIYENIENQDDI